MPLPNGPKPKGLPILPDLPSVCLSVVAWLALPSERSVDCHPRTPHTSTWPARDRLCALPRHTHPKARFRVRFERAPALYGVQGTSRLCGPASPLPRSLGSTLSFSEFSLPLPFPRSVRFILPPSFHSLTSPASPRRPPPRAHLHRARKHRVSSSAFPSQPVPWHPKPKSQPLL